MAQFAVRPASADDAGAMAELFAAVAGERDGIVAEPPVDIDERAAQFARTVASSVVAVADSRIIGMLHVEATRHGFGEIGMLVDRGWRGRGVGSALVQAAIGLAREQGLHKLSLEVFAHNTAAIALYRKCGFVEEGRRTGQYRRADPHPPALLGPPYGRRFRAGSQPGPFRRKGQRSGTAGHDFAAKPSLTGAAAVVLLTGTAGHHAGRS